MPASHALRGDDPDAIRRVLASKLQLTSNDLAAALDVAALQRRQVSQKHAHRHQGIVYCYG